MLDLKNTIAETDNLKNKVKQAKDRINATVVRGGGYTSKSLEEIPNNIKSMLRQYKKVAIINPNIDLYKYTSSGTNRINLRIPLNLDFIPTYIHIEGFRPKSPYGERFAFGTEIEKEYEGNLIRNTRIKTITKSYVDVYLFVDGNINSAGTVKIDKVIAIE